MGKRFTDTEKWKKHFIKSLSTVNKLFFLYILDECDHAGIWHVEEEIASIRIGENIDIEQAKKELGKHIVEFDNKEKWFIPYFIEFQYGELNPTVNVHRSVLSKLKKYKLNKHLMNCSQAVKDKDKDKVIDKDKDKEMFNDARILYGGNKRGLDTEFANFKKHKDWKEHLPKLRTSIINQSKYREDKKSLKQFVPEWKHFKTWINNRCWEEEYQEVKVDRVAETYSYQKMLEIINKEGLKQSNFEFIENTKRWKKKY